MKRISFLILIIVWVLTFVTPAIVFAKVADTRDIELRAKTGNRELRSLPPVRAWIDNQTVYVSFLDLPSTATVVITNTENSETQTMSFSFPQTVSIPISQESGEEYEIQISYDSKSFVGNFELKSNL